MKEKEYWNKWSKHYKKDFEYPLFHRWLLDSIIQRLTLKEGDTILDLGTGCGRLIVNIAKKNKNINFIGLDISEGMIKKAKEIMRNLEIRAQLIVGNLDSLKIPDESIDFVVSSIAVHHIKDKKKLLSEIYSILKLGGRVFIGDFFEPKKEYRKQVVKMRRKNLKMANNFDKSIKETYKKMTEWEKKYHPREYHIDPIELKKLFFLVGFRKSGIIKSFHDKLAIVWGTK